MTVSNNAYVADGVVPVDATTASYQGTQADSRVGAQKDEFSATQGGLHNYDRGGVGSGPGSSPTASAEEASSAKPNGQAGVNVGAPYVNSSPEAVQGEPVLPEGVPAPPEVSDPPVSVDVVPNEPQVVAADVQSESSGS